MSLKSVRIYLEKKESDFFTVLERDISQLVNCKLLIFDDLSALTFPSDSEPAIFLIWNDSNILTKQKTILDIYAETPYLLLSDNELTKSEMDQFAHPTHLHLTKGTYSFSLLNLMVNYAERIIDDMNHSIHYDSLRGQVVVLENVFEESLDMLLQVDPSSKLIINVNRQITIALGYTREEMIGKDFSIILPPAPIDEEDAFQGNMLETGYIRTKSGGLIPTESTFRLFPVNGKMAIWATYRDITERKEAEEKVREQKKFYEFILDNIDSYISVLDSNFKYEYSNPVFVSNREIRKWLEHKTDSDLADKLGYEIDFAEKRKQNLENALNKNEIVQFEELIQDHEENKKYLLRKYIPIADSKSNKKRVISYGIDITERKLSEERISYLAYYDSLTGLANRTLFVDQATQALKNQSTSDSLIACYFFDIDNFKFINESLGHTKGDILLQMVASRLKRVMSETHVVARFGGDEYAILKLGVANKSAAAEFAQKVLDILSQPFHIMGRDLYTTISMGIALSPNDGNTTLELLKNADMAMYKAKELGRNNFRFFTNELILRSEKRLYIENSLRKAIQNGELVLFFQPKISTLTNKVCGAEALIRWKHPERGWVPPSDFIPVAEDSGIIERLGDWVLEQTCKLKKEWEKEDLPNFTVSINVSGKQLTRSNWSYKVHQTIVTFEIKPEEIELELTESSIMENPEKSIEAFRYLSDFGVKVSIDDFGTGYSSLSYLKKIDADVIKIDRSFVMDLETDEDDRAICRAIINMAKSLGMEVIAEGVENEAQKNLLHEFGCHNIQGYFYSKPLPNEDFIKFVKNFNEKNRIR